MLRDVFSQTTYQVMMRVLRRTIVDTAIVVAAYTAALWMVHSVYILRWDRSWFLLLCVVAVYLIFNAAFGFYNRLWGRGGPGEPLWVCISTELAMLTLVLFVGVFYASIATSDVLAVIFIGGNLTLAGFLGFRYRLLVWKRLFGSRTACLEKECKRVLVVGVIQEAERLACRLGDDKTNCFKVVGFIDDHRERMHIVLNKWHVLGSSAEIPGLVQTNNVDVIVIIQSQFNGVELNRLIDCCLQTQAQIKILPDGLDVLNNRRWDLYMLRDVTAEDLLRREQYRIDDVLCRRMIADRVVLVTGASGSIGSELCRQISMFSPAKLILLDNNESNLHDLAVELKADPNHPPLCMVLGDVTHGSKLQQLFESERPQLVFHAAAYKHVPILETHPEEAIRVNILGTLILSEYAARYDVERFVFISTDKAVNPTSVMGASKRICEIWLSALNHITTKTKYTTVRFGNVIGSRGSVVPIFNRQIEWGGPLTVTHPEMTRYFMSIPEAVSLVLHAATLGTENDVFMLDMGDQVSILELAQRMIRLRGLRVNSDIQISYSGIRPGEKLHEELSYGDEVSQETNHPRIRKLRKNTQPDLKLVLDAILLLADAAQRQYWHKQLRDAILMAARMDWQSFRDLMFDMGLFGDYQPPKLLQGYSILIDANVIQNIVNYHPMHYATA